MREVFEKIIEQLERFTKDTDEISKTNESYNGAGGFYKAIEIVKQAAAECNGGWILCSERLPEAEQEVLLQFEDNMAVGFYFVESGCFDGTTNWYALSDNDLYTDCDSKPIAWMPLPEPYTKGE